jgi:hypothetical protein
MMLIAEPGLPAQIGPRPPRELDGSPRTNAGAPAVISDFVEVGIERSFVAKLCYVRPQLANQ